MLRYLLDRLPDNAHVLDAGFGFGPYSDLVLGEYPGMSLTGYEGKREQVEDCRDFFSREGFGQRCRFEVLDLLELEEESLYDLAIAVDIMEHIEDDVRVLKNLKRALKPGGILLIHTPAQEQDSRTVAEHHSFVGEHVRDGYNIEELREKLREAGFGKVDLRFTYGRWGMASWWLMQGIPMRMIGKCRLSALLLPLYYLLVFPFANRLMIADLPLDHLKGGGLLAVARA